MTPICPYDKFQNRSRVKQCLLDTTGPLSWGTHTAMISVTTLQKIKPSIFYHGRGEARELLSLIEMLLKINDFWGRESQLPLKVGVLLGWPQSSEWPYPREYMSNTNWILWVVKWKRRWGNGLGRHCRKWWDEYDHNTFTKLRINKNSMLEILLESYSKPKSVMVSLGIIEL